MTNASPLSKPRRRQDTSRTCLPNSRKCCLELAREHGHCAALYEYSKRTRAAPAARREEGGAIEVSKDLRLSVFAVSRHVSGLEPQYR